MRTKILMAIIGYSLFQHYTSGNSAGCSWSFENLYSASYCNGNHQKYAESAKYDDEGYYIGEDTITESEIVENEDSFAAAEMTGSSELALSDREKQIRRIKSNL